MAITMVVYRHEQDGDPVQELEARLAQVAELHQKLSVVIEQLATARGELRQKLVLVLDGVQRITTASTVRLVLVRPVDGVSAVGVGPLAEAAEPVDAAVLAGIKSHNGHMFGYGDRIDTIDLRTLLVDSEHITAFPLVTAGNLQGVLWLGFSQKPAWTESQQAIVTVLVGQLSILLAEAQEVAASRQQQEWLSAIVNSAVDPVVVVDDSLTILLLNPAAQQAAGVEAQDAVGQPLGDIESLADLVNLVQQDAKSFDAPHALEFVGANQRTYTPSVTQVRFANGVMNARVLWLRDVTHFKRVNANLSDFLSTVSHDMRSPLTFMKGYCDMMGMVGPLNERQTTFVEKIASGVVQMSDMVEKILEAGKLDPETGSYELAREPTDIAEIAQRAVASMTAAADKKAIALHSTIHAGIPVINVDKAMLGSAFTNLIENAVKYTPEGGTVEVEAGITANNLVFRVSDNGLGISETDQQKLFKRNVRIRRKEWQRVKGSGLGLFIVKNVARRHGGDAWVESTEGQGSSFCLAIPLDGRNRVGGAGGE